MAGVGEGKYFYLLGFCSDRRSTPRPPSGKWMGLSGENHQIGVCQSCASTGGIRWHIMAALGNLTGVIKMEADCL